MPPSSAVMKVAEELLLIGDNRPRAPLPAVVLQLDSETATSRTATIEGEMPSFMQSNQNQLPVDATETLQSMAGIPMARMIFLASCQHSRNILYDAR